MKHQASWSQSKRGQRQNAPAAPGPPDSRHRPLPGARACLALVAIIVLGLAGCGGGSGVGSTADVRTCLEQAGATDVAVETSDPLVREAEAALRATVGGATVVISWWNNPEQAKISADAAEAFVPDATDPEAADTIAETMTYWTGTPNADGWAAIVDDCIEP